MEHTVMHYLYRDADNYKIHNYAVLPDVMTESQIDRIMATLQDGEYFIPGQVGLPEERYYGTDADGPYFELTRDDFEVTRFIPMQAEHCHMTSEELTSRFEEVARTTGWTEEYAMNYEKLIEMEG